MDVIKLKSGSKFEDSNNYSRVVAVGDWIFVSNTAGRNYTTREISSDAGEQAEQAFRNIEAALKEVGATLADVVRIITCIPNREDKPAIVAVQAKYMEGVNPANTSHCTPLLNDEMKVEIEVTAYRGLGKMAQENRRVQLS